MLGTVARLCVDRGFGFIRRPNERELVFFHVSDLADGLIFEESLTESRVEFDVLDSPKGPRAERVRLAE